MGSAALVGSAAVLDCQWRQQQGINSRAGVSFAAGLDCHWRSQPQLASACIHRTVAKRGIPEGRVCWLSVWAEAALLDGHRGQACGGGLVAGLLPRRHVGAVGGRVVIHETRLRPFCVASVALHAHEA